MELVCASQMNKLADHVAEWLAHGRRDPLRPECVVVGSGLTESWLRQYLALDLRSKNPMRVRACWQVHYINVFVNDWLHRMSTVADEKRKPQTHPASCDGFAWRLYRMLDGLGDDPVFEPLRAYLAGQESGWRRFGLATTLAAMYDDYQVYRPELLQAWQKNPAKAVNKNEPQWQRELWRRLADENVASYLESFGQIFDKAKSCGIENEYDRVTVFCPGAVPPVYLEFLDRLPVPVRLYLLDPVVSCRPESLPRATGRLQGYPQTPLSFQNPLNQKLADSHAAFLTEAERRATSVIRLIHDDQTFANEKTNTVLAQIQKDITADAAPEETGSVAWPDGDDSVRIHLCHSPMREVQVLRDHMLRWFSEDPTLEPRQVQVFVTDMATYAPYIEAVFGADDYADDKAIPYALADRFALSTSPTAQAFLKLLDAGKSRFSAPEVLDLLECESMQLAFGLDAADLETIRSLIKQAGIRWGLDAAQRMQISGAAFTPATSWQHGLDRLLLGFAVGDSRNALQAGLIDAGGLGEVAVEPISSAADARLVAILKTIVSRLEWAAVFLKEKQTLPEWVERLSRILEQFFVNTNETFHEITLIRRHLDDLAELAQNANVVEMVVEADAVKSYLSSKLEQAQSADDTAANTVVFAGLRVAAVQSRRVVCVLGLGDGLYPRADVRPSFHLIGKDTALNGDPSLREADRGAWLEVLLCARERLHLSYVGRSEKENEEIPPSTVVSELKDFLYARFSDLHQKELPAWDKGSEMLSHFEVLHHLQAFHEDYFNGKDAKLFSCSENDLIAATALLGSKKETPPRGICKTTELQTGEEEIQIDELAAFFVNPAKAYFTKTLKVFFGAGEQTLAETEPFDLDPLSGYAVTGAVMEYQLSGGKSPAPVRETLVQRGLLPLGESGVKAFTKTWDDVSALLDTTLSVTPSEENLITVKDLIRGASAAETQNIRIKIKLDANEHPVTLLGRVRVCTYGGQPVYAAARPANLKAKDLIRAWTAHLCVCAIGCNVRTIIIPKETKKICVLTPLPEHEAKDILETMVKWMRQGQSKPLPFAPETSQVYVTTLQKALAEAAGKQDAEVEVEEGDDPVQAAIEAAADKWKDDGEIFFSGPSEEADVYFCRAFGRGGVVSHPDFACITEEFYAPLFSHLEQV